MLKADRPQINKLNFHFKTLEQEEQSKLRTSRRKEMMKITVEINEIENKKTMKSKAASLKRSKKLTNL